MVGGWKHVPLRWKTAVHPVPSSLTYRTLVYFTMKSGFKVEGGRYESVPMSYSWSSPTTTSLTALILVFYPISTIFNNVKRNILVWKINCNNS